MKEITHEWAIKVLRPAQKAELSKRRALMGPIPTLSNNPDLQFDLLLEQGKKITQEMVSDGWYDRFMQSHGFNVKCHLCTSGNILFEHLD